MRQFTAAEAARPHFSLPLEIMAAAVSLWPAKVSVDILAKRLIIMPALYVAKFPANESSYLVSLTFLLLGKEES
jgi:ABC-type sulfate transport system substrate-binding protein